MAALDNGATLEFHYNDVWSRAPEIGETVHYIALGSAIEFEKLYPRDLKSK